MKNIILFLLSIFVLVSCNKSDPVTTDELTIYAYDSFTSDWGAGPKLVKEFEKSHGVKVNLIGFGDAGTVLTKAISEKDAPVADIIVGIDNNMLAKALSENILKSYRPKGIEDVPKELHFPKGYKLIPFDYGYFSIVYDSETLKNPPESLEDLTKPQYRDSLILFDPRTSSPGLGFLLWTISVYGDDYLKFWDRLKPSILTTTDGWSSGYGLFLNGEAPMVLSYSTSPTYHAEYENSTRYKALEFTDGNYRQLEGIGILNGSKNFENAKKFIDYILTEDAQLILAMSNIMFPVNRNVELPESFNHAIKPKRALQLDYKKIEESYDKWLDSWAINAVK